jgi:hypothetical protein
MKLIYLRKRCYAADHFVGDKEFTKAAIKAGVQVFHHIRNFSPLKFRLSLYEPYMSIWLKKVGNC